jgi:hypothetical protein
MNRIIKFAALMLVAVMLVVAMTSCATRPGEVSERDFNLAVELPDSLSGFTQTAYNDKGEVLFTFSVKFDKNTLYRIEYGADGLVDYELYIQYADRQYHQYRNVYNDKGEPKSWQKSKVKSEVWDANISVLFGFDDTYGLDEFLYFEDYTFDAEKGVYYADDIPVMFDGLFYTDVTVRFEGKRMVELNFTQNANKNKIRLEQTFEYDGGEFVLSDASSSKCINMSEAIGNWTMTKD